MFRRFEGEEKFDRKVIQKSDSIILKEGIENEWMEPMRRAEREEREEDMRGDQYRAGLAGLLERREAETRERREDITLGRSVVKIS